MTPPMISAIRGVAIHAAMGAHAMLEKRDLDGDAVWKMKDSRANEGQ